MVNYFITFGAGGQKYYDAVIRLTSQANNVNLFDKIIGYTDVDLKNDFEFWNKHGTFITNNQRGYGYWIWKSYIIKKTMDTMLDGDILLYLDAGCEIDINKKQILSDYINYVTTECLIVTETHIPNIVIYFEKDWTKMDLLLQLDMLDDKYLSTPSYQAGAQLILKCDKMIAHVNQWYDLCCNYHNIDDSPSISSNLQCFREHRHDQSVCSLLIKKNNLCSNKYSLYDCISYSRNLSIVSILNN